MAVRLHMKLGVVAEHDRLPDSPDTVVVVEPSVGSVARSKGHLYLLVTAQVSSRHALEATRLTAETIRNEYYYDESAGIRVCIQKAIATANKRLVHQADRLGLRSQGGNGPIGVGVAVVRGNEMYVATVGPAEAYLIRQARLSTLPDPHRERGLPSGEIEPDVWRGEISVGDSLVLVSPNVVAKLGPEELKDAMLTLHPQSAMEHLHHRFVAADGSGSDGAIAFEATEVSATAHQRTLVPVRPAEPLAGAPDRSPIPLADNVQAANNAVRAASANAKTAAGGALERVVVRAQDLLPRRRPAYRRVTPLASRRETQRRAAVALLAFLVVFAGLGLGVWAFAPGGTGTQAISSIDTGQHALEVIRANLDEVTGPGVDLIEAEPGRAEELLTEAYEQLSVASRNGIRSTTLEPLRLRTVANLDRLYGVVTVGSRPVYTFEPKEDKPPTDLKAVVRGPDGATFVLDASTKTVWRVDFKDKKATAAVKAGQKARGGTVETPRLIAVGLRDLLVLDSKNQLWRWRAANKSGKGTVTEIRVNGASSWGDDIMALGTFERIASEGLYNLYVVDPSEEQILAYSPARDGSGFPGAPTQWLSTTRATNTMSALHIDGDLFTLENGAITRFVSGKNDGWEGAAPRDTLLRSAPNYTLMAGAGERRNGVVYGFDRRNARLIAVDKADGHYVAQYRLAGGADGWEDMRGFYVAPSGDDPEAPPMIVWISGDAVHQATLEQISKGPTASPGPSGAPSAAPSAAP
ncbi:MAG TPA: hypothetical protein VFU17_00610 [Candidatus Limnocylindrales bacterium]|nr:hypothetical protein [Candidatus Limnocylindrales bacterium]